MGKYDRTEEQDILLVKIIRHRNSRPGPEKTERLF